MERGQKRPMGTHMLCSGLTQDEGLPRVEARTTLGNGGRSGQESSRKAQDPQTHHVLHQNFHVF